MIKVTIGWYVLLFQYEIVYNTPHFHFLSAHLWYCQLLLLCILTLSPKLCDVHYFHVHCFPWTSLDTKFAKNSILNSFSFVKLASWKQETRAFLPKVWLACPGPRTLKVQDTKSGGLWEAGGGTWLPRLKCVWTLTWRLVSLLGCTRIDHSFELFFYPWIFGGES